MVLPHKQAQDYLKQWYETELTYIRDFQRWKQNRISNLDYQDNFRGALNYFLVYRWIGPKRLPSLMTRTLDWVRGSDPDGVDEFAESLRELFNGKIMTSIASKILFLNNPQKVSPISGEVRTALGLEANTYDEFRPLLTRFRQEHDEEIQRNLATIAPALSAIESEFKAEIKNIETVRISRYTDQLLRGIGYESKRVSFEDERLGRAGVSVIKTKEKSELEMDKQLERSKLSPKDNLIIRSEDSDYYPERIRRIYQETLKAFDNELDILCATGLRSLIEGICDAKAICGKNEKLSRKIDSLTKLGIPASIAENLHGLRFMGNTAVHELTAPDPEDLRLAIDIIEDLLSIVFVLDYKAKRLGDKFIPSRDQTRPNDS